MNDDQTECIP